MKKPIKVAVLVTAILTSVVGSFSTSWAGESVDLVTTAETKVQLEDGVEIELLAISNWQWERTWTKHLKASGHAERVRDGLWWRPDGALWADVDFKRGGVSTGSPNSFNFLIKVSGLEDGYAVVSKTLGGETHRTYVTGVRNELGEPIADHLLVYLNDFDYPPTKTSLFVGIADGPWQTVESNRLDWSAHEPHEINWDFLGSLTGRWPRQEGDHVRVELSHTYVDAQTRLEMIDQAGEVHIAEEYRRSAGLGIVGVDYVFKNTQLSDVNEIRFAKRDFGRWVEFKDIVLGIDAIKPFYSWGRLLELKGEPAPDFDQIQAWSTGVPLAMDQLKGNVVLLDFWNVNCAPCVALFPELISLHEKYEGQGLRIIGVHADIGLSLSETQEKIEGFKQNIWQVDNLPFPIVFDGGGKATRPNTTAKSLGATNAAYAITSYPTSILIDKNGNVVGEINLHEEGYEKQIESLLGR